MQLPIIISKIDANKLIRVRPIDLRDKSPETFEIRLGIQRAYWQGYPPSLNITSSQELDYPVS